MLIKKYQNEKIIFNKLSNINTKKILYKMLITIGFYTRSFIHVRNFKTVLHFFQRLHVTILKRYHENQIISRFVKHVFGFLNCILTSEIPDTFLHNHDIPSLCTNGPIIITAYTQQSALIAINYAQFYF